MEDLDSVNIMKQITDTLSSLILKAGEIMLKAHDIESGDHRVTEFKDRDGLRNIKAHAGLFRSMGHHRILRVEALKP